MTRYLARRLAASLLLLFLVLTATFFLVQLAPGDPVAILADPRLPRAERERMASLYGLDRPVAVQYAAWLGAAGRGDWGTSFVHRRPVTDVLAEALPATLLLGLGGLAVQYAVGVPLGIAAARRRGGLLDGSLRIGALLLYSMPTFWLALMAILLFAYAVPLFPPSHMRSIGAAALGGGARLADLLHHLALPALVLGLTSAGETVRFVRNQMIGVLQEDYIRTARAKGLSERRVIWIHALPNALVPVVQLLGLALPGLLNGVLILEVIFSWPGMGGLVFQSILARDFPLIMAATAFSGLLVIAGTLLADLLHALLDPRVRVARPAVGAAGG